MTVKEHYDKHLANFYSWMTGDFETKCNEFKKFLTDNSIAPFSNKIAIDLLERDMEFKAFRLQRLASRLQQLTLTNNFWMNSK